MSLVRRAFFGDVGLKKLSRVRFLEFKAAIIKDLDNDVAVRRSKLLSLRTVRRKSI